MKKKKKVYEKPQVTRIRLDAKCAVLGHCKSASTAGLLQVECDGPPSACSTLGS